MKTFNLITRTHLDYLQREGFFLTV